LSALGQVLLDARPHRTLLVRHVIRRDSDSRSTGALGSPPPRGEMTGRIPQPRADVVRHLG